VVRKPATSRVKCALAANDTLIKQDQSSSIGNGTQLAINDCKSGDLSQQWTITADAQTGAFIFKNAQSGRCLDEPNANTSNGVPIQTYDCWAPASQKFFVQAFPMN